MRSEKKIREKLKIFESQQKNEEKFVFLITIFFIQNQGNLEEFYVQSDFLSLSNFPWKIQRVKENSFRKNE